MPCFFNLLKYVLRGIPSRRAALALLPEHLRKASSSVSRSHAGLSWPKGSSVESSAKPLLEFER